MSDLARILEKHAPVIWTPQFAEGRIVACECKGPMDAEEWRAHLAAVLASLPDDRVAEAEAKVAEALSILDARHYPREITTWSNSHRDKTDPEYTPTQNLHYEGSPNCTEACLDTFSICNGCGTKTCSESDLRAALSGGDAT